MKSRDFCRREARKKARRRRRIAQEVFGISCYDNLHEYSKGKIIRPQEEKPPLHSDMKKKISMDEDEFDFFQNE
jgi:hypothetical protein